MQFTEAEAADVKKWVVKKLDDISDADSDVLADYVLALVRSEASDEEIKKTSVEQLEDFLREHTTAFVDELFATFGPKKPAPSATPLSHSHPQIPGDSSQSQHPFNAPAGPKAAFGTAPGGIPFGRGGGQDGANFNNRKRTYLEGFEQQNEDGVPQNRAFKTPRRGRGGGRGDWMGRDGRHAPAAQPFPPSQPGGFPMMPGFPPFDQNDPMAAMMALQNMGFPQMPAMSGMPGMPPGAPGQPGADQMRGQNNQRCPFYDTQGICYLGATCPYQHGDVAANDDGYDPKNANIVMDPQRVDGHAPMRGNDRGRGRGRGGFSGRGRGRSEFSSAGPNEDRSVTTIVVEQIPDEKFSEEAVREFFSQFGNIADISLQPYKKLAFVKYDSYEEAKRAWSSPKVIFDNRFVKVYWHKPSRKDEQNGGDQPVAPAFNQEEFEKQQEEAQKAYEEKMKKRQEAEEAKQALERQRDELLKKQQEEKARLLQRLGAAAEPSNGTGAAAGSSGEAAADENVSEETKQLRAQLAALEDEAKSLGLDPASAEPAPPYGDRGGYRGRGSHRGRGTYRGRGGFEPSFRGGWRGRGGHASRGRGGVLRLDNRPRRVAVSGVELNSDKDEALRQYLIGIGEYESIEPNPGHPGSVIVAFKERYQAEKFMFSNWNIPSVGEVQLSWVANPPITTEPPAGTTASTDVKSGDEEQDTIMQPAPAVTERKDAPQDMDYDVAEDDNWGVE